MTAAASPSATAPAAWADALLLSFGQAGYVRAEPAILQPAEPFLDLSGEDIRKSLYLTTDAEFIHLNSVRIAFQPRAPPIS